MLTIIELAAYLKLFAKSIRLRMVGFNFAYPITNTIYAVFMSVLVLQLRVSNGSRSRERKKNKKGYVRKSQRIKNYCTEMCVRVIQ